MKEPKVQVGILFEPQIKFILLTPYHINGEEVSGKQVVTYDNGHILWQGHSYDERNSCGRLPDQCDLF